MKLDIRVATVIVGVAIAFFPGESAVSLTPQDVSNIAQKVTVIISGAKLGSGVIINQDNNTYTVLTNWHVVEDLGTYTVETQAQTSYQVTPNSITRIPGVDLAILKFTSRQKYTVVTLGNSDTAIAGTTVYVSGAPTSVQGIEKRTVLIPDGRIVGTHPQPKDGYALIYNNITFPGMSGGPVLDENGRLVAIHGRGARDKEGQKVGFNLGIPINIFSNSQLAKSLNLRVATTTPALPPRQAPSASTPIKGRPATINGSPPGASVCPGRRC